MSKRRTATVAKRAKKPAPEYAAVLSGVVALLEDARQASVRAVNAFMTATYWEIGRRIVEFEQGGDAKASYGSKLLEMLAVDLLHRFGRGFSAVNLRLMRRFYLEWPQSEIRQTPSVELEATNGSLANLNRRFPLPWSHYVRLLKVDSVEARQFYETESLRCGWTVRQLDRQISTLFYERTLASRNKAAMLRQGSKPRPDDRLSPDEELKDPLILEFLNLKDEYSESDLEGALIQQLEEFLLELGGDFTFVARQRRLRIGDEWFRIDLLFFHRRLRCLVVVDLKIGKFTAGDVGQMHLYLNYAAEHWTYPGENPPVGLIMCAERDHAVARYALDNLPNKILAAEYRTALPAEAALVAALKCEQKRLGKATK